MLMCVGLPHVASEDTEPLVEAFLVARREQQLQSQADAEEGFAGTDVFEDGLIEPGLANLGDGVAEGADARENDLVRGGDLIGITADRGGRSDLFQGLLHAPQVGHAVIDNDDALHDLILFSRLARSPWT